MNLEEKARFKIFLWDQFVRPIILFFNIDQLKTILLILVFFAIIILKSTSLFIVLFILLMIIFIYDMMKYYRSGEFMKNYRDYKSRKNKYSDWRKVIKQIKTQKEEAPKKIGGEVEVDAKEGLV